MKEILFDATEAEVRRNDVVMNLIRFFPDHEALIVEAAMKAGVTRDEIDGIGVSLNKILNVMQEALIVTTLSYNLNKDDGESSDIPVFYDWLVKHADANSLVCVRTPKYEDDPARKDVVFITNLGLTVPQDEVLRLLAKCFANPKDSQIIFVRTHGVIGQKEA